MATVRIATTTWGAFGRSRMPGGNASAMHFLGGLRDHASLIAPACQFVFRGLAAAVPGADCGRAVGRTASDLVELHLACKALIQADDGHAEMQKVGDDGNSVVS
jgi:hypothetical protein